MLRESTFNSPGIGTLRVIGDYEGEFFIKDIAFGEFQTSDGTLYGPLQPAAVIVILAFPELAIAVCESDVAAIEEYARKLGLDLFGDQ